jgi:hypothetical protein
VILPYSYRPPAANAVDYNALLSDMMGNMGQHMEFFVFPSMDISKHLIADPRSEGSLTVHPANAGTIPKPKKHGIER